MKRGLKLKELTKDKKWKEKNNEYTKELQLFFDVVDNVEDFQLKDSIVSQMLRCDKVLTEIAEKIFIEHYKLGYKEAQKGQTNIKND